MDTTIIVYLSSFFFLVFLGRLLKLDDFFKPKYGYSINWIFTIIAAVFTFFIHFVTHMCSRQPL